MKQPQLQPLHTTQAHMPRHLRVSEKPRQAAWPARLRRRNGKFESETTTLTTPAHHSSLRAPPHPHLRKGTTGSMTSVPPAALWRTSITRYCSTILLVDLVADIYYVY